MKITRSIYWLIIITAAGMAVGSHFLTRPMSALPAEYSPLLYYTFFTVLCFVPLIGGLTGLFRQTEGQARGRLFKYLLVLQICLLLMALLLQWACPAYPFLKAIAVIAVTVLGIQGIVGRLDPSLPHPLAKFRAHEDMKG